MSFNNKKNANVKKPTAPLPSGKYEEYLSLEYYTSKEYSTLERLSGMAFKADQKFAKLLQDELAYTIHFRSCRRPESDDDDYDNNEANAAKVNETDEDTVEIRETIAFVNAKWAVKIARDNYYQYLSTVQSYYKCIKESKMNKNSSGGDRKEVEEVIFF